MTVVAEAGPYFTEPAASTVGWMAGMSAMPAKIMQTTCARGEGRKVQSGRRTNEAAAPASEKAAWRRRRGGGGGKLTRGRRSTCAMRPASQPTSRMAATER